jgi:hypothetical protein
VSSMVDVQRSVDMDDIMEVESDMEQAVLYASPSLTRDFATQAHTHYCTRFIHLLHLDLLENLDHLPSHTSSHPQQTRMHP